MIRLIVAAGVAVLVAAFSTVALRSGLDETRFIFSGRQREVAIDALERERGWLALQGCLRHELALGVRTDGHVFRLGAERFDPDAHDRVFTPLSAAEDCADDRPPGKLYALVEDDEALGTTITYAYQQQIAPPPVAVVLGGAVGYGTGRADLAARAREFYQREIKVDVTGLPLFVKGRRPGVLWVALLTAAAGVHGYLLVLVGAWWVWRRWRRKRAILAGHTSEAEEEFFESETLE